MSEGEGDDGDDELFNVYELLRHQIIKDILPVCPSNLPLIILIGWSDDQIKQWIRVTDKKACSSYFFGLACRLAYTKDTFNVLPSPTGAAVRNPALDAAYDTLDAALEELFVLVREAQLFAFAAYERGDKVIRIFNNSAPHPGKTIQLENVLQDLLNSAM